jgi:putative holliday junction resolvase
MTIGDKVVEEDASSIPTSGRLAGIDYGSVRVGLATCDPSQRWVTPFDTYVRRNERLDAAFFVEFAKREGIVGWVLGLPIHCDGKESQKSAEVRRFAEWLESVSDLPFALFDERFTTAEARHLLRDTPLSPEKKKKQLDRLAALLILNGFIESRRSAVSQNEALEDRRQPLL